MKTKLLLQIALSALSAFAAAQQQPAPQPPPEITFQADVE